MTVFEDYITHEILEQGWIDSSTFPNETIHVTCRKDWEDYNNIFVSYLRNSAKQRIYFKLSKELPTFEQFKNQIVGNVSEELIKEIYAFITSPYKYTTSWTVYFSIKDLLKSMEYEKLPIEKYSKLLKENRLHEFIDL